MTHTVVLGLICAGAPTPITVTFLSVLYYFIKRNKLSVSQRYT